MVRWLNNFGHDIGSTDKNFDGQKRFTQTFSTKFDYKTSMTMTMGKIPRCHW